MKEIIIKLDSDDEKKVSWVLAFNNLELASDKVVFFYLMNDGDNDIEICNIKVSSTQKASNIEVHSVLGEPFFTRENRLKPVNKRTARIDELPLITAYSCSNADDLASHGILDVLEMREELTTYETEPEIIVSPNTAVALICNGLGNLTGLVNIKEIIKEED